jgi:hypothetical protein
MCKLCAEALPQQFVYSFHKGYLTILLVQTEGEFITVSLRVLSAEKVVNVAPPFKVDTDVLHADCDFFILHGYNYTENQTGSKVYNSL